jgi:hypothetical protein
MKFFKTTPLNLLFNSGLTHHITNRLDGIHLYKPIKIYGIDFTNMDAVDDMEVDGETYNILVMHYATDDTIPYESISRDRVAKFDLVVSGHDHMYYPISKEGKTTMLRPGSFTRRTKDEYNLTRDIIVYLLDIKTLEIEEVKLPGVEPAEAVFKNTTFDEKVLDLYDNKYNSLFSSLKKDNNIDTMTDLLNAILKNLPITVDNKSKELVKKHLISRGYKLEE